MVRASGEIVRGCGDGGGGAGADSALSSRRRCIMRVSWRRVDALSAGRAAGAVDAAAGTTDGGGASAAEKVRRRRFVGRSSRLGVHMDDGQRRHLPAPAVRLRHPLRRHSIGGAGASIGRHRAEAPPSGGLGQAQADSGLPGQARAASAPDGACWNRDECCTDAAFVAVRRAARRCPVAPGPPGREHTRRMRRTMRDTINVQLAPGVADDHPRGASAGHARPRW